MNLNEFLEKFEEKKRNKVIKILRKLLNTTIGLDTSLNELIKREYYSLRDSNENIEKELIKEVVESIPIINGTRKKFLDLNHGKIILLYKKNVINEVNEKLNKFWGF